MQGTRIGPYTLLELVGAGATAEVWKVADDAGVPFALKVLTHGARQVARRMHREGQILARLLHPNIVRVIEPIQVAGRPALVLEWVAGRSLESWAQSPPSVPEIDRMVHGIAAGLAFAHARGIVHRDLKPANVLLAEGPGGAFLPKIADFGIAHADDGFGQTAHGAMLGTPRYMAPEQIRDSSQVDPRADLFALGCMLFEWLTGRLPFPEQDPVGRFLAIQRGPPEPPAELEPRFRAALLAALEPDPEDRPAGIAAWLLILGGALRSEIPTAVAAAMRVGEHTARIPLTRPLIGRQATLAAIDRALEARQVVNLVGAPGIGKTRLALEVQRQRGGAWIDLDGAPPTAARFGPRWPAASRSPSRAPQTRSSRRFRPFSVRFRSS